MNSRRAAAALLLAAAAPCFGCGGGPGVPAPVAPPAGPVSPAADRLVLLRGGSEQALAPAAAQALAADLLAALAACGDRDRRLLSEDDWAAALRGDALHLLLAAPRELAAGPGPPRRASELLAPLDGRGWILARDGDVLYSPFLGAPAELWARLRAAAG